MQHLGCIPQGSLWVYRQFPQPAKVDCGMLMFVVQHQRPQYHCR